jgi:ATP phosphoribosyltransferase regulatory subunit
VVVGLEARVPGLAITVDPVENRGFEYHTGISFAFFAKGLVGELGRGGRYRTEDGADATGFTLYTDTIMQGAPAQQAAKRLYVPAGTDDAAGQRCRAEGWTTVAGLAQAADPAAEARRLRCTHVLAGGKIVPLG